VVGDRAYPRDSVDVFFITSVKKGRDLTGVKVVAVDRKSAVEVGEELTIRSHRMKEGHDPDFARLKHTMERMPRPILRQAIRFAAWISGDHAVGLPSLGLPASPFGSAMVSSVGMLGLPMGYSPLAWMYRVPLLVLVGEILPKPIAIDGAVHVRPILPITATIDHRYVDGAQIGEALKAFREYLDAPQNFEKG
jgi:2-oxoacid dehydrogenases acyltransferase (catalytic domain)